MTVAALLSANNLMPGLNLATVMLQIDCVPSMAHN
jgi:hypothetical protein